jgi:outer membrane receptor protein involved in Fe transport
VPQDNFVGGFSTVSLSSSYEFSDALTVFVRADNLFDAHYHEYVGFPNPGLYARAGLSYRFR